MPAAGRRAGNWSLFPNRDPDRRYLAIPATQDHYAYGSFGLPVDRKKRLQVTSLAIDSTVCGTAYLVSVREHLESYGSFVIQEWWPDSRRVTDVDGEEPRTLRP
jgi:hypothetical protein